MYVHIRMHTKGLLLATFYTLSLSFARSDKAGSLLSSKLKQLLLWSLWNFFDFFFCKIFKLWKVNIKVARDINIQLLHN